MRQYALVLLTAKLGSAAADSATSLKLTEYGMPKEGLAFLSPLLAGAGIVIPLFLSRFTTGPRPLSVYLLGLPLRLLLNPLYMFLVPLAASVYGPDPTISAATFRAAVCAAALANVFAVNMMFVSQMAFANRVADPAIGGTYITLINTVANLGSLRPGRPPPRPPSPGRPASTSPVPRAPRLHVRRPPGAPPPRSPSPGRAAERCARHCCDARHADARAALRRATPRRRRHVDVRRGAVPARRPHDARVRAD